MVPVPGLCSRSALGADPNQVIDADNWTVLREAAEEGFLEVAKVLLACGASPRRGRGDDKVLYLFYQVTRGGRGRREDQ